MTKPPKLPGRCVHCLKEEANHLTWDHVLPKSWYPKSTPADIEKWKVPACYKCNNELGKLERDLFIRFGLAATRNPEIQDIVDRAIRSLDPRQAKNTRDEKARRKHLKQIVYESVPLSDEMEYSIYPGFGPFKGDPDPTAILIPKNSIERFTEKLLEA